MSLNRIGRLVCILTFSFLVLTPTLVLAGDQGLSWGVPVGETQQFRYYREWNSTISGYSFHDEVITLEVTENPEIPDNITVLTSLYGDPRNGIPHIERIGYWANGTDMGIFAWAIISPVLLPIGNWTLILQLFEDYLVPFGGDYEIEIIDTPDTVGYRWSYVQFDRTDFKEAWWSKTDGMLIHYRYLLYDMTDPMFETDGEVRVDAIQPFPWDIALLIGAPAGALIIIGVVIVFKRKA
jgi:hypothetical protein